MANVYSCLFLLFGCRCLFSLTFAPLEFCSICSDHVEKVLDDTVHTPSSYVDDWLRLSKLDKSHGAKADAIIYIYMLKFMKI